MWFKSYVFDFSRWLFWRITFSLYVCCVCVVFFQAEDGIRDLVRSRGLGDVYKRQVKGKLWEAFETDGQPVLLIDEIDKADIEFPNDLLLELDRMEFYVYETCLLYTSDAADERSSVDLGGRRIIKKKNTSISGREGSL